MSPAKTTLLALLQIDPELIAEVNDEVLWLISGPMTFEEVVEVAKRRERAERHFASQDLRRKAISDLAGEVERDIVESKLETLRKNFFGPSATQPDAWPVIQAMRSRLISRRNDLVSGPVSPEAPHAH